MHYIFSTISTDVKYTFYGQSANDMPAIEHTITIKGGANVATKNLITPKGVMTSVEDAEVDMLNTHPVFLRHKKKGFVHVEAKQAAPDEVASDMEARDESAPLIDDDFNGEDAPPTTSKTKKN
ncbi:hypothetical protein [Yersinia pekkanenii]|uniref:Uncharacterized protein n=1 Tax=Yersinia pekkanenii TaxID=1288385 RepID=A0A0T9R7C8_9GAMM|nr:hypothetical protein [Yersinia pekkanenii]CNI48238.1 Uncharacterised protein [Yersinia pekkanenii]CRY68207.1 Uncharacterised protein [Yersinia pekkanenii]